jgi:predicted metal-dependent hydrolase
MDYMLKRSNRSASIRISLDHSGAVSVSAPQLVPKMVIDAFVKKNSAWIERQRYKMRLKKSVNPSLEWSEKILSYFGRLYSIKTSDEPGKKIDMQNGICWVRPITGLEKDAKRTLLSWLKVKAEAHIIERVVDWAETMGVEYGSVRFGQQSSRWGSCSGENNLRFNWRLIHFPAEVIDYVVIHELAHTVHHDHSPHFWQLVARYCPGWKDHRRFLKRQVISKE